MNILKNIFLIFTLFFLTLFVIEFLTRIILFFPTNHKVFFYGFNKSLKIEVIDLSKFQINLSDRSINSKDNFENMDAPKENLINAWLFGGSTSFGNNCNSSSSWAIEIQKKNEKIKVKNFSFNGADSDQLISILDLNLQKKKPPEMIFWASKFNMSNILTKSNYRNKEFLNYEFKETEKNKFFLSIKRVDKTLKSILISYNIIEAIIIRIFPNKNVYKTEALSDKDIKMMVENFKINTLDAIKISRAKGVKEFYLISLFSDVDFKNVQKPLKDELYKEFLFQSQKKYPEFVKVIDLSHDLSKKNVNNFLCDAVHQTFEGNVFQASKINNFLINNSNFFK